MAGKLYKWLFLLSPWAILAGVVQYHFRSLLPAQRLFMGLEFFDFITVTDLWVGLLILAFIFGGAIGGDEKSVMRKLPREWLVAVGLLLLAGGLQLLFQQIYEPVLVTPFEYFRSMILFPLIFAVLGYRTLDSRMVKGLMRSYLMMVGFFCVVALVQHFTGWFPGEQKDFMGRLVWPFIDFVTLKSSSANWAAFFVTPAVVLSFAGLVRTGKAVIGKGRRGAMLKAKNFWLYGAVFVVAGVTLYLTQSYGGYAAVLAALVLYLFRALKFRYFLLSMVFVALIVGAGYLHQQTTWKYQVLTGEVDYRFANSAASREDIYKMGLGMIERHPALGVGMNQFQSYFAINQEEILGHKLNESHVPPHAHNFFLSMWTNLGFFGFAAMVILILGIFWRTRLRADHPAVFVLVAIMTHGLIDSWYWTQETAYIFWLMVMFAYAYSPGANSSAHAAAKLSPAKRPVAHEA